MSISHVNGIATSSLSHINGVSKTAVSEINGITAGFAVGPNTKTPVFCCGMECGRIVNSSNGGQHLYSATGGYSISTATVRSGSRSLRVNATGGTQQQLEFQVAAATISVARFYINFATLPDQNTWLFFVSPLANADVVGIAFKLSDSKIYCAKNVSSNITYAGTGVSVTTGQWYRIDVRIDQTSGAKTCDAQVDGVSLTQSTNTGTAAPGKLRLFFSLGTTGEWFIDDVLISHTSGDYPLGAGYVNHFVPVSDGTHNIAVSGDFKKGNGTNISNATTDSYQLIDEVPLDDSTPDANDFIGQTVDTGGGSEYVEHVFGPASGISTPTAGPRAVDVIYGYHAAGTGTGDHTLKVNDNGVEDTVNAFNAAGVTTIRYAHKHYANAPSDSNSWRISGADGNFNNLKTRFGYSSDGNPDQYLDCVMIEAEFAE